MSGKVKCPFCSTECEFANGQNRYYRYSCVICSVFLISDKALALINSSKDKYNLLNCVSENIGSGGYMNLWHLEHEKIPANMLSEDTTPKKLDYFMSLPIVHSDKPANILLYVAKIISGKDPFTEIDLYRRDVLSLKIESHIELEKWVELLFRSKFIDYTKLSPEKVMYPSDPNNPPWANVSITAQGWEEVFKRRQALKSKKVFIAMQFDWGDLGALKNQFITAVQEACADCGYKADIVTEHHTGPIMDKIIASINESHFVIADFTFNNRGAYFEAGYARALGLPVIHTVLEGHVDNKNDQQKHLHFDIQQINYIRWDKPETLKEKVLARIKAVII